MNIRTGKPRFEPPKPKPPVQPENKDFSYNPQDPAVMSDAPSTISDVWSKDGKPQTDTVKLANKKAVFDAFGNALIGGEAADVILREEIPQIIFGDVRINCQFQIS